MTAYEIISIFLGILTLLATFGSLIVAFRIQSMIGFAFPHTR